MKKFFEYYDKVIRILLIAATAGFVTICIAQVFVRFVLGGSIVLMLMVPKNWKELQVTYMPTFAPDKTLTFTMKAADVIRG